MVAETSQKVDGKKRVVCSEPIAFYAYSESPFIEQVNDDGERSMRDIAGLMNNADSSDENPCVTYSDVLADICQHYRLPDWPPGRTVVSLGDGLRLYHRGEYCSYIGSLNMEDQKRTSFQKVSAYEATDSRHNRVENLGTTNY